MSRLTPQLQRMLGEANMHHAYREFQQAVTLLLEIVRLAPGLAQPYQTLGLIYEELECPSKAIKLFMLAAHLSKRDTHQWKQLAMMAAKHKQYAEAQYCLGRVLTVQPTDADALWERAHLFAAAGEGKKAAAALQAMHQKMPNDLQVGLQLARFLYKLGSPDAAEKLLNQLLSTYTPLNPSSLNNPTPNPIQSSTLVSSPNHPLPSTSSPDAASRQAQHVAGEEGEGSQPSGPPARTGGSIFSRLHCLNMLLELLFERGRYEEALRAIHTHAADIKAERPMWSPPVELCVKEGVCSAYLGDLTAAHRLWASLLSRPDRLVCFSDQLYEVALCVLQCKEWARALTLLDELAHTEYAPSTHLPRGRCLLELCEIVEAMRAFTRAFDRDPANSDKVLCITELLISKGYPSHALWLLQRHTAELRGKEPSEPLKEIGGGGGGGSSEEWRDGVGRGDGGRVGRDGAKGSAQIGEEVELAVEAAIGDGLRAGFTVDEEPPLDGEIEAEIASEATQPAHPAEGGRGGMHEDLRLAVVRGLAHAALGEHEESVRLLSPIAEEGGGIEGGSRQEGREEQARSGRKRQRVGEGSEGCRAGVRGDEEGIGEECEPNTLEGLGVARYLHVVGQLALSLLALGRGREAYEMVSRVLDLNKHEARQEIRQEGAHEEEPTGEEGRDPSAREAREFWLLRAVCVRLAFGCGEWAAAYQHARGLCMQRPHSWMGWALLYTVSAKEKQRGLDERWILRSLVRLQTADQVALGVAHNFLLSRSFKNAMMEYVQLQVRYPEEPMLALCVAVTQLQLVISRNKRCGYSALLGFGWLGEYAKRRDQEEVAYNTGRAHHHLGMLHLATADYERVLRICAERLETRKRGRSDSDPCIDPDVGLAREAAHNLALICKGSGSKALARKIVRSVPLV